jgi:predicted dehydrogenase
MQTSRRVFLGKSAAAFAGLAAGRAAGANDRIRVGWIGCGGIGKVDIKTFLDNPEVDCVVLCDVDDNQLASGLAHIERLRGMRPEAVKDFRRVVERKDVDVCLVATPDHWHALPTIYACQEGKDVYVEKPLATSIAEGRAMVEAAKRHQRVVQMGTQWRSGDHYREAIETVQAGRLGKIRLIRAWAYLDWVGGIGHPPDGEPPAGVDYDMWLGPAPKRPFNKNRFHFNFRWFWDYAGGLMTDWAVHLLNLALWAMGPAPPVTVTSSGGKFVVDDNSETPDTQMAVYDFPTHTLIWEHLMVGGVGPGNRPHGLSFTGTEATLIVDGDGWEVIPEPRKKKLRTFKRPVDPNDRGADGRPAHVRNFLDCTRSRQQPVTNLEVGHFVSTVAHLGNIALQSGSKIKWQPGEERVEGLPETNMFITRAYRKPWALPGGKS